MGQFPCDRIFPKCFYCSNSSWLKCLKYLPPPPPPPPPPPTEAAEEEDGLIVCAWYIFVSIPELDNTFLIQFATVDFVIALCGL